MVWQPIETAPKDRFLLLCGPSGYTTTPLVFTTGRMCSDYHAGRWIDHANDDLTDWGFEPTHWLPLPEAPGTQAQPVLSQSTEDNIISDLQSQFDTEGITEYDSGDALIRLSDAIAAVGDNLARHTQSVPEGYMLVPIEPTEEMLRIATAEYIQVCSRRLHPNIAWRRAFQAMLAAAPNEQGGIEHIRVPQEQ